MQFCSNFLIPGNKPFPLFLCSSDYHSTGISWEPSKNQPELEEMPQEYCCFTTGSSGTFFPTPTEGIKQADS